MIRLFTANGALAAAAIVATSIASPSVHAQGTAPGRIEQDTRPALEPVRRDPIRLTRPAFEEQVPAGAQNLRFTLGAVQVTGNKTIATADLAPLWAARLGQSTTLAEAFGIAAAVGARYREQGYILSQAIVPAQDLATDRPATLRIEVLEGYVERVSFSGFSSQRLAEHLAPVTAERPLRLATLERALLLVNELAGISAQANLKAGAAPNSSELELVAQRSPRAFSVQVHNRATPSQGRLRLEASADFRGMAGDFDRHTLRLITSGDQRLNLLSYAGEAPIGVSGLKSQWSASRSTSEPDTPLPNVDTNSTNASFGLAYPILRSRQTNVGVRAALAGYDNESGSGATSRDRIRAIRIGLTVDHADDLAGLSLVDLELSRGLSGLGASKAGDPLLNGARPDFSKAVLYAARLQSLGGEWSLLGAATAQVSNDKLPTAEQLGLGGEVFVRAFDPSEAIGENGYAAKFELRRNATLGPLTMTLYAFADAGRVKRKQVGAPDLAISLAAWGAGVRFSGPAGMRGYVELAKPLRQDVASQGDRDPRAFAGLGVEF